MNVHIPIDSQDPFERPIDAILADIAIDLQLPPGLHAQVGKRYASVRNYIERPDSPLAGRVEHFYPQGSMAIDATISSRGSDDEYDLDFISQLSVANDVAPKIPLDLLEEALKGYPVDKPIRRQTRCITIYYADGMHIDVTPSSRLVTPGERESLIFHAKREEPSSKHLRVPMNAYGFCHWYRERTPLELRFARELARRYYETAGMAFDAEADVDEIPEQTPLIAKNVATVALQLLKQYRNIVYVDYRGRIPPSVMLSFYAATAATPGMTLSEMLVRLCRLIAREIAMACRERKLLNVVNPTFYADVFTDRWPTCLEEQEDWMRKVNSLADTIDYLKREGVALETAQQILRPLFGDRAVTRGVSRFNQRAGRAMQSGSQRYTPRGGLYVPSKPALVTGIGCSVSAPAAARTHTFMGGHLP